ncbi:hypothetical protein ABPG72_016536 [Tetrahymena utriculariae]
MSHKQQQGFKNFEDIFDQTSTIGSEKLKQMKTFFRYNLVEVYKKNYIELRKQHNANCNRITKQSSLRRQISGAHCKAMEIRNCYQSIRKRILTIIEKQGDLYKI